MATGHLAGGEHAQDGASTMRDNGSTSTAREKMLPARLHGWRRVRRTTKLTYRPVLERDGVVLDRVRQNVQVDGHVVDLSARETAVLQALMIRSGRVVHRPVLAAAAWGSDIEADHCPLDRLLDQLRHRLQPSPLSPTRLYRVGDTGYVFGSLAEADGEPTP